MSISSDTFIKNHQNRRLLGCYVWHLRNIVLLVAFAHNLAPHSDFWGSKDEGVATPRNYSPDFPKSPEIPGNDVRPGASEPPFTRAGGQDDGSMHKANSLK